MQTQLQELQKELDPKRTELQQLKSQTPDKFGDLLQTVDSKCAEAQELKDKAASNL